MSAPTTVATDRHQASRTPPDAPRSAQRRRAGSIRRRLLITTLGASTAAVVGFGAPLAVAVAHIERDRATLRLGEEASRVFARVPDEVLLAGRPVRLPLTYDGAGRQLQVGVYSASGARTFGRGPTTSPLAARAARAARQQSGGEGAQLALAIPVRTDRPVSVVVRVATFRSYVNHDIHEAWLLMGVLALGVVAASSALAMLLARRVTRTLSAVALAAHRLGSGDFTVEVPGGEFRETREVASALAGTARRIAALLERERAFSSNASHQIRTPLTALRLRLETAGYEPSVTVEQLTAEALPELDRLERTIDDLLAITRDVEPVGAFVEPSAVLAGLAARWRPTARRQGRALEIEVEGPLPRVRASAAGLQHALDVLVDNALRHGAGAVRVRARTAPGAVAFEVSDEGSGVSGDAEAVFHRRNPGAAGSGIGLALARSLVEADGGRLQLTSPGPRPVFTLLLPLSAAGTGDDD